MHIYNIIYNIYNIYINIYIYIYKYICNIRTKTLNRHYILATKSFMFIHNHQAVKIQYESN